MIRYLLLLLIPVLYCTCSESVGDDDDDPPTVSFDRKAMLETWADNTIIPALDELRARSLGLNNDAEIFAQDPSPDELQSLRATYVQAYLAWQKVSPYMTGPGEALRLREQLNIYPTDTSRLARKSAADLDLPSNIDVQGFPALDYMLFGTDEPANYAADILRLCSRIHQLANSAADRWKDYRAEYVQNSGNSATASVDRTVNDFIFWYEKHLRAGKVGIPAGIFSNATRPELAEAYHNGAISRLLFLEGLDTAKDFFNTEQGLKDYLDALGVERDGQLLSDRINANFINARKIAEQLDADFATQVTQDNTAMLRLYDALQANVILLKVDMLQALGINVDYVDADGD